MDESSPQSPSYSQEELAALGLGSCGSDVLIHRSVVLFNPGQIHLGSHVRIDCFSLLSAGPEGIHIGDRVHLAVSSYVFGGGGRVEFAPFSGLSSRVSLYTATDDYGGEFLTNPTVPERYRNCLNGPITLGRHVIIGANSVIMPNVILGDGVAVGAMSFINKSVEAFNVVVGRPAKVIGKRDQGLLALEQELLATEAGE
jgi:galactoside O-acetyltransferase